MLRKSVFSVAVLAVMSSGCLSRRPVFAPPPSGVEAVEGYGRAVIEGEEAILKGRFAFLFRRPDLGRIEVLDPLNRTVYFIVIRDDETYVVVPSRKAYTLDKTDALAGRLLGFPFRPGEAVLLLSDRWEDQEAGLDSTGWTVTEDAKGRTVRGEKGSLTFEIREFFTKAGVPRTIGFTEGLVTGSVKVLSVRFNPPARPEAFETGFVENFVRMPWEKLQELMRDED